ncbi:DUF3343 domain-containing protein [Clostridium sp. Cult2]|uniref:DUF3343 domain-containing protein n=1 Tax=Clostridium sp. Cult2 TaxID=2079003 RepID=UPI001F481484|nr:DUF3343 domain-containing protein [Clostridium sp. Cult2]MCF6465673.1 hypothetical protein [Clostridium sp. Cult2]
MGYNNRYYICAFTSKNMAMYLFSSLDGLGYKEFQLISTPCEIKAGCSYSIKFGNIKYLDILKREAKKLGIEVSNIYFFERKNGKRSIKKLTI